MAVELVLNGNGNYDAICEACGSVLAENISEEYVVNNPNACDKWLDELYTSHISEDSSCPDYEEYEIVCDKCGEVLGTYSPEYAMKYPNSLDKWEAQLLAQHELECPHSDIQPDEPKLLIKGKLDLDGIEKEFEIWEVYSLHSHFDTIYQTEHYKTKWGKGGVDSMDKEKIIKVWESAVNNFIKANNLEPEDGWLLATESFLTLNYELSKKDLLKENEELEYEFSYKENKINYFLKEKELINYGEIDEIVEEA